MQESKIEILKLNNDHSVEERVGHLEQVVLVINTKIIKLYELIENKCGLSLTPDKSYEEIINLQYNDENTSDKIIALQIAQSVINQIAPLDISDPFASHLTHIKEKFIKFFKVLNISKSDEILEKVELLAGEILNVMDLFDDYFWGYSLETNQLMSSGIPDFMKSSAEKTRELILEFLRLGNIVQIEFSAGSELNPDMQQFILEAVNPNKNERMIIETLRPGFIKTCGDGDSIIFRKAIVKIR
jgi:molecular chaperone GrpE (heat shock protein)